MGWIQSPLTKKTRRKQDPEISATRSLFQGSAGLSQGPVLLTPSCCAPVLHQTREGTIAGTNGSR